jgi:hypothetical protein
LGQQQTVLDRSVFAGQPAAGPQLTTDNTKQAKSIVGSRANGYKSEGSDWDILYFSTEEPIAKERRHELVESIHVGPLNIGMVDGNEIEFPFDNWEWNEIDSVQATYSGRKFIDYPGGIKDANDPVYSTRKCNAFCLWRNQ